MIKTKREPVQKNGQSKKSIEIDTAQIKRASNVIRSVNHKLRQNMINLLEKAGKSDVTDIYVKLRLEQSVASQHLGILRKSGVVVGKREGKFIFYSVNKERLNEIFGMIGELAK